MYTITSLQNKKNLFVTLFKLTVLFYFIFGITATAKAQCITPTGDQTSYGIDSWIGYVYPNFTSTAVPPTDVFTTPYKGYLTQAETFNQNVGYNNISGPNLCGGYSNQFAIRYKMKKTFVPGYYGIVVGGDDGYRLSLDGGATFAISNWTDHAYLTTTQSFYLSGPTELVLEYYEQGGISQVSFTYAKCSTPSSSPQNINGITSICKGSSTTLTASGGDSALGSVYEWGTGTTIGTGTIAGQILQSITVSPTSATTYWVRRADLSPCSYLTDGITQLVTVNSASSPPTVLSGNTTICPGNSTILTASGGYGASGATYEWGTGAVVGANSIANQTAASITVSPTITTTYWVRRVDVSPCNANAAGIFTTVNVTSTQGNPALFGDNVWNVYGYSKADITLATTIYQGYYSVNTLGIDTQTGTNSWLFSLSPSSAAGWLGCPVPVDQFTMVHKRKGFPCGNYSIKLLNWDDATVVYINGVSVWNCSAWSGANSCNGTVGTFNLDSNSTIEIRVREDYGNSNLSLVLTNTNTFTASTAPISIAGITSVCALTNTILTATGGTLGSTGVYQWGKGTTVGSNILPGQTTASILVSPITSTTYWVRRIDSTCSNPTDAIFQLVTVNQPSIGGSISSNQTICSGSQPADITLSGNTGTVVRWEKSSDAAFTTPTTIINTLVTLSGVTIGNLTSTTYFRAIVANGTCASITSNTASIAIITSPTTATNNSSQTICASGTVILGGNIPNVGIGTWSLISGPNTSLIQFDNPALPTASFSPTLAGTYVVRWSINNSCGITNYADATITVGEGITTTWNGSSWNKGNPTSTSTAIITGNYRSTLNGGSIRACTLTVNNNAKVDILSGDDIILNGKLTVATGSSLTIENNSSLVQYSNVTNSGNIIVKHNSSSLFRLDYTLWSSPVVGQNLNLFSPLTSVSPSRFYTYDTSLDVYNPIATPTASVFELSKGYLIRMPNTWVAVGGTAASWTGTFTGVPNNGNISVTMSNAGKGYNAVGNPYPSALNFANFIFANKDNIEGTVYFWRKTNNSANPVSYSTCTTVGCTVNNGHTYTHPDLVSAGQGFIVKAKPGRTTLNFTNAMRSSDNVNQFFRSATVDRFWLELNNTSNVSFGKKLVAYIPDATLGYDNGLDGLFLNDSKTALISMADDNEVVIQARPSFDVQDILPLVLKTDIADTYTINLQQAEGIFNGSQDIFLKDKLTNTSHDFKTGPYTFSTEAGRFDSRFEIVYQNPLAVQQASITGNTVIVYKQNNELVVNSGNTTMEDVKVFDIRGRLLVEKNKVNSAETKIDTSKFATQVLIIQITTENQIKIIKKIVN